MSTEFLTSTIAVGLYMRFVEHTCFKMVVGLRRCKRYLPLRADWGGIHNSVVDAPKQEIHIA